MYCTEHSGHTIPAFSFVLLLLTFQLLLLIFRMRAKTSEFLKVLNRAKIEEDSAKKKPSYMGKTPFVQRERVVIKSTLLMFHLTLCVCLCSMISELIKDFFFKCLLYLFLFNIKWHVLIKNVLSKSSKLFCFYMSQTSKSVISKFFQEIRLRLVLKQVGIGICVLLLQKLNLHQLF